MSSRREEKDERRRRREMDTRDRIRRGVQILVQCGQQQGHDAARIQADVNDAITEALEGDEPWERAIEGEWWVNSAGVFRLIFARDHVDRHDQTQQESIYAFVKTELEAALGER
jgi:hypothetical protein